LSFTGTDQQSGVGYQTIIHSHLKERDSDNSKNVAKELECDDLKGTPASECKRWDTTHNYGYQTMCCTYRRDFDTNTDTTGTSLRSNLIDEGKEMDYDDMKNTPAFDSYLINIDSKSTKSNNLTNAGKEYDLKNTAESECDSVTSTHDSYFGDIDYEKLKNSILRNEAKELECDNLKSTSKSECDSLTNTPKSSATVVTTISASFLSPNQLTIHEEEECDEEDQKSVANKIKTNTRNHIDRTSLQCSTVLSSPQRSTMLVLISKGVCFRDQAFNQDRAIFLLSSKNINHTIIDGMDQEQAKRREELFRVSGIRGHYPQIFITSNVSGLQYIGNHEILQRLNNDGKLCPEVFNDQINSETLDRVITVIGNETSFLSI